MLCQVQGVSGKVAGMITGVYPTPKKMLRAVAEAIQAGGRREAEGLLHRSVPGVGAALSAKIYRELFSGDE